MKQTAVEWLIEDLFKKGIINSDSWVWNDNIDIKQIIEQAKEMEKEQIIEAFCVGRDNSVDYFEPYTKNLEEVNYYNQTFKQD